MARISEQMPNLSKTFRMIGKSILENPDAFAKKSLRVLAESLNVSEPSIIRFGREFGYRGLPELRLAIARDMGSHDSALLASLEPALFEKAKQHIEEKRAIAYTASTLIDDEQAIVLDSGSTVKFFAQQLSGAAPLKIMTTGLGTLLSLLQFEQHTLMLPGGNVRRDAMALTGRMVENVMGSMFFDTAFIGADSIDLDFGLSTYSEDEAHLTRIILRSARKTIVLVDNSKFRSPQLHRICGLDEIDAIVTDTDLPMDQRQRLLNSNVALHIARPAELRK